MAINNAERIVDWDQLYPGRFLKAGLLAPNEKRVLTISGVLLEQLVGDKGPEMKGVLSFSDEPLQLALNKTNGICLREMFGRVPYKWTGKRFAIFASVWAGDPCIRIWGSPDIDEDMQLTIQLPRKKPFQMTMHAMGDEISLRRAAKRAGDQRRSAPPPAPADPLGERCTELLGLLALAEDDDAVTDIEADIATEEFNPRETRVLNKAVAKRREQVKVDEEPASDDVPFK